MNEHIGPDFSENVTEQENGRETSRQEHTDAQNERNETSGNTTVLGRGDERQEDRSGPVGQERQVESREAPHAAMLEELSSPGDTSPFARLTVDGMTFDFPSAMGALRQVTSEPVINDTEDTVVDDWQKVHFVSQHPDNYKLELTQQHIEHLLRARDQFVITGDRRAAEYLASLRGVPVPSINGLSGWKYVFSDLTGQPRPDGGYPERGDAETRAAVERDLRTMLRYPGATDRLVDMMMSHFGDFAGSERDIQIARALNGVRTALMAYIDPRSRDSLYEQEQIDRAGLETAKEVFDREDLLLQQAVEKVLVDSLHSSEHPAEV